MKDERRKMKPEHPARCQHLQFHPSSVILRPFNSRLHKAVAGFRVPFSISPEIHCTRRPATTLRDSLPEIHTHALPDAEWWLVGRGRIVYFDDDFNDACVAAEKVLRVASFQEERGADTTHGAAIRQFGVGVIVDGHRL